MRWFAVLLILLGLAGLVVWAGMAEGAPRWAISATSWARRLASRPRPGWGPARRPTVQPIARLRRLAPRGRRRRDWRVYFDETMELTAPGSPARTPVRASDARREETPSRVMEVIGGFLWLALLIPLLGATLAAALWGVGLLLGRALSGAVQ